MSSIEVVAPYNLATIKHVPLNNEADLEKALSTAELLERGKSLSKVERVAILEKTAFLLKEKRDTLALEAAREGGKPLADSYIEIDRGIQGIGVAIETLHQMAGREIPMGITPSSEGRLAVTVKQPIGTVAAISAFNHPFNLIIHQAIPAIATGCPVIVKPAPTTPLSCITLVETLYEAGLPKEWCQVLHLENEVAQKMVSDSRVRFLNFIGSSKVGWHLRSLLPPGAHCTLEHGGAAPVIVEPDADIDDMLPLIVKGGYYHAGQVCVSVQRVFVHDSIFDEVVSKMMPMVQGLKVGDPTDSATEVGPLILPKENDRLASWVKSALTSGAELKAGGEKVSDTCFAPTLLVDPPPNTEVSTQEIFGPVVCLYRYKDASDAIQRANALPLCFQAAIFTKHIDRALEMAKGLQAMAVMINDHTAFRVDWMPFGGSRESGLGVGGINYSMQDLTQDKLLVVRSPALN